MEILVRTAQAGDIPQVHELIYELAVFERAGNEMSLTLPQFQADFEAFDCPFRIWVAIEQNTHRIVGMALCYFIYSTWKGRSLYLEDIVVRESFRDKGVGSMLFERIILAAHEMQVGRLGWQVLDWNTAAIKFYQKYDAELDPEWVNGRLSKAEIAALAKKIRVGAV